MANTQEFVTIIRLNDQEAKNNLEQLRKKVDDLKAARDKAIAGREDNTFIKDINKALKTARAELKSYESNVSKTMATLENLSTSSVADIEKAMRALKRMQKDATSPEEWNRMQVLIDKCAERIDVLKGGLKGAALETENLAKVMGNLGSASLNQLNQAKAYLESQVADMNPNSTSYATSVNQLKEVKARIQEINTEQQKLVTTIDRYEKELENTHQDMSTVRRETELVTKTLNNISGASIRDIEYSLKILTERMRGLDHGSEEFQRMTQHAKRLRTELEAIRNEGAAQKSWLGQMADGFNRWQTVIVGAVASLTGLTMTVRKCVSDYAEMEDTMASTRKYTGMTDDQVRELNEEFKKMDTRTARTELNAMAGAAGRLGITSKEAVLEFVDGADKISVALGDDLGAGAVDTIGKLAMAFGEDKTMGLRGAMLATGSALNELAQSSSANAGYIVDFTSRLAGIGLQADLSQQDIMGFASVLDQNMQQAEMSATAMSQLITSMFKDPAKFAKLAGQDVKQFTDLLKTDANSAILTFLDALKQKGGFDQLAPMFDDMGLSGQRCVGVLSTMANKLDDVKTAQQVANKAYADGTSVLNEFDTMNNTVNAQLDKAKNRFAELSIELGEKLVPVASKTITMGSLMVNLLLKLIEFVSKYKVTIATLTVAITALVIAEEAHIIKQKAIALWNNVIVAGTKKLWAVLAAHPYVALAAAVAGVIAFMIDLTRKTNSQTQAMEDLKKIRDKAREDMVDEKQKIETLAAVARDEKRSMDDRITAVNELNRIIPDYNGQLDATTGKYKENKKALDDYLKSLVRKYEIEGAKSMLADLGKQAAKSKVDLENAQKALEAAKKAGTGITYTTSWGAVGNTTSDVLGRAQVQLDKAQQQVDEVKARQDAIMNAWGEDLKTAAVQQVKNNPPQPPASGNGGTESEKDRKAREQAQKRAEEERKAAAAAALKAKKEADKADKAETELQLSQNATMYAQGLIDYKTFIENREQIQLEGIAKRKTHWDEESNEYKALLDQENEITMKHDEDLLQLKLKDIERQRQETAAKIQLSYYDQKSQMYMNEDAVNEALFQNDMEAMQQRLDALAQGSEEWLNVKDEMEQMQREHQLQNEQSYQERLLKLRQQYAREDVSIQEKIALDGLDQLHKKGLIKEEEYQQMRRQIQLSYAEQQSEVNLQNSTGEVTRRNASTAYRTAKNNATAEAQSQPTQTIGQQLFGDISIYSSTMAQLKQMYESDAITYAEYQEAKKQATSDFADGMVTKMQAAYDQVSQIMGAMSSYYEAQSSYEQAVITKKYDKQIEAAGNNQKKAQKLEEKKQKELAKVKSKYNKKAMKLEIAQAFASTAMAAINAYASASKVNWVLGPIAAAMATAAGMIQIAAIKKQHAAEEEGYYEGGFTGGKRYRREAGVVHEGEFVANHTAVNNSRILPALQLIDQAQRNNTVASLTAADISRSLGQGSATVVSAPSVTIENNNEELNRTLSDTSDAVDSLRVLLASGIIAKISMEDLDRDMKHWNQLKNNK